MAESSSNQRLSRSEEVQDWQNIARIMHTWHPDLRAHTERIISEKDIPLAEPGLVDHSGRNISTGEHKEHDTEAITLDRNEIQPRTIGTGCTEIVLQRHGEYIRDTASPNAGSLTPEAIQLETESAAQYFSKLIDSVPEAERDTLSVLFVSSDTRYAGGGQRSYETTEIAQRVAEQLLQETGVHLLNVLNISPDSTNQGAPVAMQTLREPHMFDKSQDFVEFMRQKYGDLGKDFWIAFEEDREQEARLAMGAEGPDEIADRMKSALGILARYSKVFHEQNPDSRLIIWAGTHYDTISPFVKRDVLHKEKSTAVHVDYGGGAVIDINQAQQVSTVVTGNKYELSL